MIFSKNIRIPNLSDSPIANPVGSTPPASFLFTPAQLPHRKWGASKSGCAIGPHAAGPRVSSQATVLQDAVGHQTWIPGKCPLLLFMEGYSWKNHGTKYD